MQQRIFGLRDASRILEMRSSWGEREREGLKKPVNLGKCRECRCGCPRDGWEDLVYLHEGQLRSVPSNLLQFLLLLSS